MADREEDMCAKAAMRSFDCDIVEEGGSFPKVVLSAEIMLLRVGGVCFADLGALKARVLEAVKKAVTMEVEEDKEAEDAQDDE